MNEQTEEFRPLIQQPFIWDDGSKTSFLIPLHVTHSEMDRVCNMLRSLVVSGVSSKENTDG